MHHRQRSPIETLNFNAIDLAREPDRSQNHVDELLGAG